MKIKEIEHTISLLVRLHKRGHAFEDETIKDIMKIIKRERMWWIFESFWGIIITGFILTLLLTN